MGQIYKKTRGKLYLTIILSWIQFIFFPLNKKTSNVGAFL